MPKSRGRRETVMAPKELEVFLLDKKKQLEDLKLRINEIDSSAAAVAAAASAQAADDKPTTDDDIESATLAELLKRDPSLSLEQHAMMIFCSFARGVKSCGGSFQTFLKDLPNLKKLLITYGALDEITQNRFDRYLHSENWWKTASSTDPTKIFRKKDLEPVEKVLAVYRKSKSFSSGAIDLNLSADEDDRQSSVEEIPDPDQSSSGQEVLVPCHECRVFSCSNCLTPFKDGDFMVTEIPSMDRTNSEGEKCVSLEVALISIFEPNNPYPRWIKSKEKAASLTSRLLEMLEKAFMEDLKKEESINIEEILSPEQNRQLEKKLWELCEQVTKYVQEQGDLKPCMEMAYQKLGGIKTKKGPKENDSYVTPNEIKAYFVVKMREFKSERDPKSASTEFSAKLAEAVHSKDVFGLPDFQLCEGCGELLTILFSAWENYHAKRISEDMYFYHIMYGFKRAKNAQDVIYRPAPESKMHIFNKYSKECHPIGCLERSTCKHVKLNLGETKKDLMRNAVGNLHAYMEESYRRVFNEIISQIDVVSDRGDDEENDEDDGSLSPDADFEDDMAIAADCEKTLKLEDDDPEEDEDVKESLA